MSRRWRPDLVSCQIPGRRISKGGLRAPARARTTKDLRVLAAQLGYADLRSTMFYTQPLQEDVDEALDATWV